VTRHLSDVTPVDLDAIAARAARGDGDAFSALCHLLNDDVWRYCHALTGDRELAFEASQETFVRLVRAIRTFRGDSPVKPFVIVIARRAVAGVLRQHVRHRAQRVDTLTEPTLPDHAGTVDLQLLLGVLPEDLRQAFVLTQQLGLSYSDAARICDCPVGTVRSRVYRARERLVAALQADSTQEATDG
jgi:RNA polymerase sigma-70 factor, ECF subfamily